jgi:hypothetical protein
MMLERAVGVFEVDLPLHVAVRARGVARRPTWRGCTSVRANGGASIKVDATA